MRFRWRVYAKAFSTLGCPELSLEGVVQLGQRFGIDQFELRALEGNLNLPEYFARRYGKPEELRSALANTGVRIVALDTSFKLIGSGESDRAQLLAFLPWAEELGVRWLRVFDGGDTLDQPSLEEARGTLVWWQRVRAQRGVAMELMIETHDLLLDAVRIEKFTTAMGSVPFYLLWDAHHTWKKGSENPVRTWRAIQRQVVHIHVKDSISQPRPPSPFTYVPPGEGEFPMAVLRAVLAEEFPAAVSLEWEKVWHPYLAPLDVALAAAERAQWW